MKVFNVKRSWKQEGYKSSVGSLKRRARLIDSTSVNWKEIARHRLKGRREVTSLVEATSQTILLFNDSSFHDAQRYKRRQFKRHCTALFLPTPQGTEATQFERYVFGQSQEFTHISLLQVHLQAETGLGTNEALEDKPLSIDTLRTGELDLYCPCKFSLSGRYIIRAIYTHIALCCPPDKISLGPI